MTTTFLISKQVSFTAVSLLLLSLVHVSAALVNNDVNHRVPNNGWRSLRSVLGSGSKSTMGGMMPKMMMMNHPHNIIGDLTTSNDDEEPNKKNQEEEGRMSTTRRNLFTNAAIVFGASAGCGCCCLVSRPQAAYGLAQITSPSTELLEAYDLPRNKLRDAAFACGMSTGMVDYEKEASSKKTKLFQTLFDYLQTKGQSESVSIVEVGMGSFPNAKYYQQIDGLDIIGVDPNDSMEGYARDNAKREGLLTKNQDSLRIVHGVSEALPFDDNSVDAVVCTLTLCSVVDPTKSVAEIKRILKPGGKFLFWEHVLSETDFNLAAQQHLLTPSQVRMADGCHLDRRTGVVLREANFQQLDIEYMELNGFSYLNPTVCGIATA